MRTRDTVTTKVRVGWELYLTLTKRGLGKRNSRNRNTELDSAMLRSMFRVGLTLCLQISSVKSVLSVVKNKIAFFYHGYR